MTQTPIITWTGVGNKIIPETPIRTSSATQFYRDTIYMYLDESGNFDFTESGSTYFIMTCVVTARPFMASHALMDYRYDCLESGKCIDKFHACEDTRDVRTEVYRKMATFSEHWRAYSISIAKKCIPGKLRTADALYSKVFSWIVDEVYKNECSSDIKKAIVITDNLPKEAKKKAVEGPLKAFMKAKFQNSGIKYSLMHHPSNCDPNLQLADYACWAVHRKLTRREEWPYSSIEKSFIEIGTVEIEEGDEYSSPSS